MAPAVPVPIDQRFAQLIQQFGLTKNSFAISLGKTASVVQHLIDGRNKPGYDLLCKVFEIYPNVSRDWLLLGRGPMLVGGEPAPRPAPARPLPAESPLEPIDVSEFGAPAPRRLNGAAARLQPDEIMATLALAAAAAQPAHATAPPAQAAPETAAPASSAPRPTAQAAPAETSASAPEPALAASTPPVAPVALAAAAPAAFPPPAMSAAPAAPAAPADAYLAAALHAQHLQHQLALAELRNQHLQEQQNMLREMLAMARQGMV